MGEIRRIVNEARCSTLETLQWFSHRCWESSQSLDKELCCVFCEERPDTADVVECKSAGLGHSSNVVVLRLLIIDKGHTVTSSTVTARSM